MMSKKGVFKAAGYIATGVAITAGGLFLNMKYHVVDKAKDLLNRDRMATYIQKSPQKANEAFIDSVHVYQRSGELSDKDLSGLIDKDMALRSGKENVDSLYAMVDKATKQYMADKVLSGMDPGERMKLIGSQYKTDKEKGSLANELSSGLGKEELENTIMNMYRVSDYRFHNGMDIALGIAKDETQKGIDKTRQFIYDMLKGSEKQQNALP